MISAVSNRLLCLKADQINKAEPLIIITDWILQLWKVVMLQSCLLVCTCGVSLCELASTLIAHYVIEGKIGQKVLQIKAEF